MQFRENLVISRGGTGTRRLPGSGQVLHYPAVPEPAGYYFKIRPDLGNFLFVTIFATLNYTSHSGHLSCDRL